MSMMQLQQYPPYCIGGKITSTNDKVHVAVIAKIGSEVNLWRSRCTYGRDCFSTTENFAEDVAKQLLVNVGMPQTFLNGDDSDMIEKLARMLRAFTLDRRGVAIDYVCVVVSVFKGRCFYNVVNTADNFRTTRILPSSQQVQRVARDQGGESSWAAGATSLRRFKVEDKEENCAICLGGFNSVSDDAARLPCSHVCHYVCILEWFVKSGTCPLCRFPCSLATRYD